ncbi:hypothetical protein F7Q88_08010 [Castellaniella defragrans]|nr:hypothetical protein F7Q88_08010 [Castellaniella defragrans]
MNISRLKQVSTIKFAAVSVGRTTNHRETILRGIHRAASRQARRIFPESPGSRAARRHRPCGAARVPGLDGGRAGAGRRRHFPGQPRRRWPRWRNGVHLVLRDRGQGRGSLGLDPVPADPQRGLAGAGDRFRRRRRRLGPHQGRLP